MFTSILFTIYKYDCQLCEVSPQPYVITYSRFKYYCDFLSPFIYTPFSLLIPVPQYAKGGYISSVFRPFENSVCPLRQKFISLY